MLWYDTPSGRKLLKALVKALKVKYVDHHFILIISYMPLHSTLLVLIIVTIK
jgi:hypothetical protein